MNEETTLGRLTAALQKLERLESQRDEMLTELEVRKQETEAIKTRIGVLDKRAALAGKFDLKQIVTMLAGSGGVASLISGLVMYAITSEVTKQERDVEDNREEILEMKAEYQADIGRVIARLDQRGDWMRDRERVESELKTDVRSMKVDIQNAKDQAETAGQKRFTSDDWAEFKLSYYYELGEQGDEDARQWSMLIEHAERISAMEGTKKEE